MKVHDKIRVMREINQWSQEEMAERLSMSANGYAKIKRGQSNINLEKLQQIANVFNIDMGALITSKDHSIFFAVGGDNSYNLTNSHFGTNEALSAEVEKLNALLKMKDELLKQKDAEIEILKELVGLLKTNK
ncbi:helix-turn-helix protein [Nicoletella semolina]|uniref:Helix-turn-helix protein n=1 Tax=Nicoletella semolina TaxID=271160 RepID=A0A4R2NBA0_9PAST|nr:helix-turn-helix transcriptional regulator [Nicoletella semolina]MDH2924814.1 transcriptional regulator [Nicoletella semolina]TCP18347.1 helix-turn-helix protein [Nicoletella semolina]